MSRFQIMWWWHPRGWYLGWSRPPSPGLRLVYRWMLSLGPLEIRRWEDRNG